VFSRLAESTEHGAVAPLHRIVLLPAPCSSPAPWHRTVPLSPPRRHSICRALCLASRRDYRQRLAAYRADRLARRQAVRARRLGPGIAGRRRPDLPLRRDRRRGA
jgi:hypothetical protein